MINVINAYDSEGGFNLVSWGALVFIGVMALMMGLIIFLGPHPDLSMFALILVSSVLIALTILGLFVVIKKVIASL